MARNAVRQFIMQGSDESMGVATCGILGVQGAGVHDLTLGGGIEERSDNLTKLYFHNL